MATPKKTQIVITANAAVAKKVMDELAQRTDAIKQKMAALDVTTKQGQREFKKLEKELVSYNSAISQNITDEERVKHAIDNLSTTSLRKLRTALASAKKVLGTTFQDDPNLKKKQQDVKTLQAQIDKLTGSVHKQGGAWSTAMKNLTAYVGLFQVFNKVKDLVTGAIKKNLDYSGSLTDIRKVSGLTMDDVNKLSTELSKIDTRTSVEGLAKLAYEGAKLGMGKYGVDGMKQFVAAADQINVAIGEEMGDQALPALSKMVETMGLIPRMGIEKAMLATGSAMFKLSSTSTATSSNIIEFAKRLTGVSRTAGITTDQLLALGSASDSLFLMPEVSATAMSKFIVALQKNHNLIEKDLGIQQGTIKDMYAAGHAMDAIVMVLEKMRDKGNMNALGGIFKDLGSDGQRLVTAMVTMSKNVDVLKDHLYESQEAFEEATAVTSEYEMQQQSAIGILERANNLWEKAFVNPEGVDMVKNLAIAWYDMSEMMTQSPIFKGTLNSALTAVVTSVKVLAFMLPALINYIVALGVWKTVTFFISLSRAIWAAVTAQTAFNAAASKNIYAAIASVILTLVGVVTSYVHSSEEAAEAEKEAARQASEWRDKLNDAQNETNTLTQKLSNYKTMLEKANLTQAERNRIIGRFNKDFRPYINNLGIEIKNVKDLKDNYSKLAIEIQRASYYRMREDALNTGMDKERKGRVGANNVLRDYLKSYGSYYGGFTSGDIQQMLSNGQSAESVYAMMMRAGLRGRIKSEYGETKLPNIDRIRFDRHGRGSRYMYKDKYGRVHNFTGLQDEKLLSILRYNANSIKREKNKQKEIYDAFDDFVSEGYTPYTEDEPGTLENEATDKDAIKEEKRRLQAQRKAWRDELKQKQDEAKAIMDDVRNFYERQINEKMSQAISLGMDKTEQDLFVEPVRRRMNEALEQVRLAIAGQKNTWEDFKKTMKSDLIEKTDETGVNLSQNLLDNIQSNNVDALHSLMAKLGKNLNLPMSSIVAEIVAKATKNEQENLSLTAKQMEARRKIAQENDYVGTVKQNAYDDFNTMGYANPNKAEVTDKKAFDERKKRIIKMYEQARENLPQLYDIDVSGEEGRGQLMKFLFGDDPDGMAERIKQVLGNNAADWKVFYDKLIQYSDSYVEAEKKIYDQQKKITDQRWATMKRNLDNQEKLRKLQNESQLYGKRNNFLSNLGLKDVPADPEVELMKARMRAAQDYYAFVLANSKNMQLVRDADKARQEAELAYVNQMATAMKSRLSQMQSLVQPIEEFGSAVGQALADMKNDADSANEAIKNALKSMLESWAKMALNDVNTQMWKAINDAGVKKAKDKAQPDIKEGRKASANAAANGELNIPSDLGTAANPIHAIIDSAPPSSIGMDDGSGENATGRPFSQTKSVGGVETVSTGHNPGNAPVSSTTAVSSAATNAASQAGGAAASVATGQSSLGEAAVGMAGSAIGTIMNTDFGSKQSRREKREQRKQQREARKHQRELTKEAKKGAKEREKINKKGNKEITKSTEEESKAQVKTEQLKQNTTTAIVDTALNTNFQKKKDNDQKVVEQSKNTAQAENTFSIVGAVGKCFEFLGPIAGPIAAAAVMALLTGLMQWGLNAAFGGNKNKNNSPSGKSTKIVSGMLTYDSGNVQDMKPFVADNGEIYWAEDKDSIPQSGVNLLTAPTATTINGQRSLVAENGPELVVGRETTRAMMMNNPSLLKALVNYDRNYSGRNAARRTFDEGNISEATGSLSSSTPITEDVIANSTASNVALLQAVNVLLQRLNEPISAKIDMYGRGNLYDSMTKANQFMKNKS
jgi:hypothetical protein